MADRSTPPLLRDLNVFARLGVACIILTLLGGTIAAGVYLKIHYENRDGRPGLTIDDIKGHYHGIISPAPLLESLESGHPEDLDPAERTALIDWLRGDRVSTDYDNFDLGDMAPSEIMAVSCLDCHGRSASGEGTAPHIPLDYWDDVRPLSISREIRPVSTEILAASTHTHALGLAAVTLVLAWIALCTSWPRWLVGVIVGMTGAGLLADLGAWWLTRQWIDFAWMIVIGGAVFNGGVGLLGLLVLADLLMPGQRKASA